MANEKSLFFSDVPVRKAVLTLAIPTVISQLITVVYNMADTFFIGQLNDPLQVAAATLAMPCFMFLTAFANLFGLGGSSLISRCLGLEDKEKARHTAAWHWSRPHCDECRVCSLDYVYHRLSGNRQEGTAAFPVAAP